jgi:hypothetical protein
MFYSNIALTLGLLMVSACGGANIEYIYVTAETGGDSTALETEAPIPSTDGGVSTDAQASSSTSSASATMTADAAMPDTQIPDSGSLAPDAATAAEAGVDPPCTVSVPMVCSTGIEGDPLTGYPAGCAIPIPQVCDGQPLYCDVYTSVYADVGRRTVYCTRVVVRYANKGSPGGIAWGECDVISSMPAGTACGAPGTLDTVVDDAGYPEDRFLVAK